MVLDHIATITKSGIAAVPILIKDVKHNFDKQLGILSQPKQNPPLTYVIDVGRLKEVVTITGFLLDESGDSYHAKKRRVRDIVQSTGTMTIAWDSNDTDQPYTVNILKAEISEGIGILEGAESLDLEDSKVLNIMIQFALGTHKG